MKKRPSLGSNVDIFLSRTKRIDIQKTLAPEGELRRLPIDMLQRGRYQPRREIAPEAVQELAESIRTQGVLQPIIVRSIAQGRYEIIAGERRWRASQLAGLKEIPAIIKDIPDEAALAVALIENIQRENLNALEEAVALQRLSDEFGMTHQQVAESVGKSRTTVTNLLRLLSLQPDVKILLERSQIEMGHARALLALSGAKQSQAAQEVAARGLSVRETEKLVNTIQTATAPVVSNPAKKIDPNVFSLQKNLSDKLGATVVFQQQPSGKGKMVIHYNNLDELEGILGRIQ
jgi:ParB family transcriptional regulator, chromosome partitioning protein